MDYPLIGKMLAVVAVAIALRAAFLHGAWWGESRRTYWFITRLRGHGQALPLGETRNTLLMIAHRLEAQMKPATFAAFEKVAKRDAERRAAAAAKDEEKAP